MSKIRNMISDYNLDKIKFSIDRPTFEKAIGLYERGKVTNFKEDYKGSSAIVMGTHPYNVSVSDKHFDHGTCDCYLGQNDTLCKHMIAVAIYAIKKGRPLEEEDKKLIDTPGCSGKLGLLSKKDLAIVKKNLSEAMRYIKPYRGPSRIWFAYQNSLSEGCNRLSVIVSDLPISEQTAQLLVKMLLRLDKKLCEGGVDDSDGTVGGFMEETVEVLKKYYSLDPSCGNAFKILKNRETCFGWEESLVKLLKIANIHN